ncbi:MAG: ATP-binding protein [Spirochaetales bacterium]|nr:ATP-binding protein [Spirochaetales bacterium]
MYKNLIVNISDKAPLNAILKCINLVDSGIPREKEEHIVYSAMELVNNALRAHREKGCAGTPVKLKFSAEEEYLMIEVKDSGGGFDTAELPYDLNTPACQVNLESPAFQKYRERHAYTRFGMGILTARQQADRFSLAFHREGKITKRYRKGMTDGTIVTMGIKWQA